MPVLGHILSIQYDSSHLHYVWLNRHGVAFCSVVDLEVEIERERTVMEVIGPRCPRIILLQVEQSDMALHSQPPVLAHLIVYTGLQTKIERPVDVLIVQWMVGVSIDVILVIGGNEGEYGAAFYHQSTLTWIGEMILDENRDVDE